MVAIRFRCHGHFLAEKKNKGKETIAYEFAENAIETLEAQNIPVRKVDLNQMDKITNSFIL